MLTRVIFEKKSIFLETTCLLLFTGSPCFLSPLLAFLLPLSFASVLWLFDRPASKLQFLGF